ncbi:CLB4 [[Candida] subhashii]|uniref:CLB4 n=1 Tax=[Candida] subhashii TaxID=561895 RepID=A0A8J5QW74_9ASCO|nr:CLB4 [[Candida] subhashii]KAG7663370.1 CLB4 [[Candida] subhashii]
MRPLKTTSFSDENRITSHQIKPKSNTSSVSNNASASYLSTVNHHREALSDLTSQENQSYTSNYKPRHGHSHSHSQGKIQIYKQHHETHIEQPLANLHQFKKPRLETSLLKEDINKDPVNHFQYNIDEQEENKENIPDVEILEQHFEKLDDEYDEQEQISLEINPRAEQGDITSEIVQDVDLTTIHHEKQIESQHHHTLTDYHEQENHHIAHPRTSPVNVPMSPVWTPACMHEIKYVIRKYSRTILDEKDEDTYDPTMVAEYAPEIFNYLHELEEKLRPDPNYMDNQDELRWDMRSVLIDWVVQVHARFNLLPETLFLTVNYIDRFLSKRKVSLSRFQLVGAVALFIAAKYEEINCPTVQEVAYMADNAYSVDEFLKAERFMIDVLEFDMGFPGPMSFLRRISKADNYDYETRTLAKYLLEITVIDARFVASHPSWLAAGAHYLSRKLLKNGHWTELHVFYSGYTEKQLKPLAQTLLECCQDAQIHHKSIFEKYSDRKFRRSATFVQEYLNSM